MKSSSAAKPLGDHPSLPSRGAWIEISTLQAASGCRLSLPSRGAWIEIHLQSRCRYWVTEWERRLRFRPRVTLPLLFLFSFFSFNQDRTGRIFAVVGAVGMCVNGHACGAVGNDVCGLWESRRLFHRAVNICFPSAERPFSTFPSCKMVENVLCVALLRDKMYNKCG